MKMNEVKKNIIDAVMEFGFECCWNDSEIIDCLVDNFGITREDFVSFGYADFVRDYYYDDD
jgi:hypothetical protein